MSQIGYPFVKSFAKIGEILSQSAKLPCILKCHFTHVLTSEKQFCKSTPSLCSKRATLFHSCSIFGQRLASCLVLSINNLNFCRKMASKMENAADQVIANFKANQVLGRKETSHQPKCDRIELN